jgi:hypothetical protein
MTIIAVRATIMANLSRCPVCGEAVHEVEKSDNLETIVFECEAAFYLQPGGVIAASRICAGPTQVAVRHLEAQAVAIAAEEAA